MNQEAKCNKTGEVGTKRELFLGGSNFEKEDVNGSVSLSQAHGCSLMFAHLHVVFEDMHNPDW